MWSQRWPGCRAAHAALLPLLELHSVASQTPLLAALSMRVTALAAAAVAGDSVDVRTPGALAAASEPLSADEVMQAAVGLAFGIAAAPRDPADFTAHRHLLW